MNAPTHGPRGRAPAMRVTRWQSWKKGPSRLAVWCVPSTQLGEEAKTKSGACSSRACAFPPCFPSVCTPEERSCPGSISNRRSRELKKEREERRTSTSSPSVSRFLPFNRPSRPPSYLGAWKMPPPSEQTTIAPFHPTMRIVVCNDMIIIII